MAVRPMSEKAAEILFNRYMLQSFGLGGAQLFAPSSFEEFKSGYDAKVVGFSPAREIYLQFKSPDYLERNQRFTIRTSTHQHALLKAYSKYTAYYVAPMFVSLEQVNKVQAELKTAEDFLKNFVCVEVSSLPPDTRSLHYCKPETHHNSPDIAFKTPTNGKSPEDAEPIVGDGWERGNTLVAKFKAGKIGALVDLESETDAAHVVNTVRSPVGVERVASSLSPSEFGVLIRVPA